MTTKEFYYNKMLSALSIWADKNKVKINMFDCSDILSIAFSISKEQALNDLLSHREIPGKLRRI